MYRIETFLEHDNTWILVGEESENFFDTAENAMKEIDNLIAIGDEWATAQYRVVDA